MPLTCLEAIQKLKKIEVLQQHFELAVSCALGELRDFEKANDLYKQLESALVEFKLNLNESLDGFEYNKEQARKFHLKEVYLEAYPDAQKWVDMLRTGEIELQDEEGIQTFIATWREENPGLPIPSYTFENDDFSYLSTLANNGLFKANSNTQLLYIPEWDNTDMILMEDWQECDFCIYNSSRKNIYKTDHYVTPLLDLDNLGLKKRVDLSRKEIDEALWKDGIAYGKKTEKHKQFLQKLGLNPEDFTVRLIRYEEYVRLANSQKFGKKEINTHFDGYYATPKSKNFCGLKGEHIDFGSTAGTLSYIALKDSGAMLAFRLVVAREKK